jgi:hypothetical protein
MKRAASSPSRGLLAEYRLCTLYAQALRVQAQNWARWRRSRLRGPSM